MMRKKSAVTTNIKGVAHDVHRQHSNLGTKAQIEETIKGALDVILQRVAAGEEVSFMGFGKFNHSIFTERTLETPVMAGVKSKIGNQMILRFRQSQKAKAVINNLWEAHKCNGTMLPVTVSDLVEVPSVSVDPDLESRESDFDPGAFGPAKKRRVRKKKEASSSTVETKKRPKKKADVVTSERPVKRPKKKADVVTEVFAE